MKGISFEGRHRHSAFTLIELLMAVAIVAILATLILAAVGSMRKKAQATECVNNLRQIGVMTAIYAGEHNNEFPAPWNGTALWLDRLIANTRFDGNLSKARLAMAAGKEGTRCPVRLGSDIQYSELFRSRFSPVASRDGGEWWFNYGMNYVYLSTAASGSRIPIRMNSVQLPSQCIYVTDSNIEPGGSPRDINRGWSAAYPYPRHDARANVLWVDGHVTAETQEWLILPANSHYWVP